jgi:hypothetical protein
VWDLSGLRQRTAGNPGAILSVPPLRPVRQNILEAANELGERPSQRVIGCFRHHIRAGGNEVSGDAERRTLVPLTLDKDTGLVYSQLGTECVEFSFDERGEEIGRLVMAVLEQ